MRKPKKSFGINEPLAHADHHKPRTRREMISQGFAAGAGVVSMGLGSNAFAGLSEDFDMFAGAMDNCPLGFEPTDRIPFICFDLAGGANVAGSNVLVGGRGGQNDFLGAGGYSKQGLPADMVPGLVNLDNGGLQDNEFVNR